MRVLETGKKKVLFNVYYDLHSSKLFDDFKFFEKEVKEAIAYGDSRFQFLNRSLFDSKQKRPLYEFVDFVSVPCGVCDECLKQYTKNWATRIMLEAKNHQECYFVTLTYDDAFCDMSLHKEHLQAFNKRLKRYLEYRGLKSDFRFYGVGEYGGTTARPHYHVIYFGLPLQDDLKIFSKTANGDYLYTSEILSKNWSMGHILVGEVSYASASYVARYCNKKKKMTKQEKIDFKDGLGLEPEFSLMSRRPGIGCSELESIEHRLIDEKKDYLFLNNGKKVSIPRYFNDKIKNKVGECSFEWLEVVSSRSEKASRFFNNDFERIKLLNDLSNKFDKLNKI